jgi:menaquinone-9 beta-reductase
MSMLRPITIVGGGLAGLSLALALQRRGIPVTVCEAGRYPRPKVCGEFIAGLDDATSRALGLAPLLDAQRRHHVASWHGRDGLMFRHRLPRPAIGVSRQWLDTRLAEAFRSAGGELRERTRVEWRAPSPGTVLACGRPRHPGGWIGLKLHVRGLFLDADLEMHLGERAYVGLAGVEDGRINVCGLFAPRPGSGGPPEAVLDRYLRSCGLIRLADRLVKAAICEDARAAVAGVHFGYARNPDRSLLALGDAFAAIPPFTGHGMAMALQSAAVALDPLLAWSEGNVEWARTTQRVRRRLQRKFALRLALARALHPWLLAPRSQSLIARLHASRVLPLRWLNHALHAS